MKALCRNAEASVMEALSRFAKHRGLGEEWNVLVHNIDQGINWAGSGHSWSHTREVLVQAILQIDPGYGENLVADAACAFLLQDCDLFGWCDTVAGRKMGCTDTEAVKKVENMLGQKLVKSCDSCDGLCLRVPDWTLRYGSATAVEKVVRHFVRPADARVWELPEWASAFMSRVFGRIFYTFGFPVPPAESSLAESFARAVVKRQTRQLLRKVATTCESLEGDGEREAFLRFVGRVARSAAKGAVLPAPGKSFEQTQLERAHAALSVIFESIAVARDKSLLFAGDLDRIRAENAKLLTQKG
ncbi:MAG: hypothetical protein AB1426_12420 [Bacillota bacterium]